MPRDFTRRPPAKLRARTRRADRASKAAARALFLHLAFA